MKTIKKESLPVLIIIILFSYSISAQTWEEIGFNLPDGDSVSNISEISFTNKNIGWLFNYYGKNGNNTLYKTTDGGQNWRTIITEKSNGTGTPVLFSMEPDFFYLIKPNSKALFTMDGGITWDSTVIANAGYGCSALYFFNVQKGITFDNHSWITTDGGKNWEKKGEISSPSDVYFYNDKLGWAVSSYNPFATDVGYIAKTTDGGISWEYQDSTFGQWVGYYGIDFLDSLKGFAVGGDADKTDDGGNNWQTIPGVGGYDIGFLDEKNGWISSAGQIYRTSDGGELWVSQLDSVMHYFFIKIIVLKKDKVAYVLGINSGNHTATLLRADLSNITNVNENKETIPGKLYLYQNYPNPFNPTTTIQYSTDNRQFVRITIYNVLGEELVTLVNEEKPAGEYKIEFNASKYNLSSGVYFCEIKIYGGNTSINGVESQRIKMVLLK